MFLFIPLSFTNSLATLLVSHLLDGGLQIHPPDTVFHRAEVFRSDGAQIYQESFLWDLLLVLC